MSRPSLVGVKLTAEQAIALARLAVEVAISAPARFSKHGTTTAVPRSIVNDIRKRCDEVGIDWRAALKECRRIEAEQISRKFDAQIAKGAA